IVEFSGIGKYIDTPVKRYSSGMYVRLAFAVAAHLEPEILIIDEVLAVGDAEFQKKCLGKMKDVSGEGRTVLFVSHNMGAISNLCNKAIILKQGKLTAIGTTDIIIKKYLTENVNIITENSFVNVEKNRRGNGKVRFTEINLTDENKNYMQEFERGQKALFTFKVKKNDQRIQNATLRICFRAAHTGEFVTTTKEEMLFFNRNNEIICSIIIDTQQFRAGIYDLYFYLGNSEESLDIVDSVTNPLIIIDSQNLAKTLEKYNGYFDIYHEFKSLSE
ncbi:MAG: Wzt carbohydrate-binding domain-containing protein, partial [Raineya sp.]|nr:Wzt carbohydrate-binding domain-containing protein [Raineya sp.]